MISLAVNKNYIKVDGSLQHHPHERRELNNIYLQTDIVQFNSNETGLGGKKFACF